MEAQPNPSPQRTQGKAQAGGCFSESKSSQAAKTFMISTAEVAEEAEVFGGCNVGPTLFVACEMIAEFAAIPPKNLCFLCYLCVSGFVVLDFVLVAAPSRCVSRFMVLTLPSPVSVFHSLLLCRARRSRRRPRLHFGGEILLRHRHRIAAFTGGPSPQHQFVFGHVLDNLSDCPVAVLLRVFEQFTEFSAGFSLPDHGHGGGRQPPARRSGRRVQAGNIMVLMTGRTLFRRDAHASHAAPDIHGVLMPIIALARKIPRRVTIHAARMLQYRQQCCERRCVPFCGGAGLYGRHGDEAEHHEGSQENKQ